MGRPGRSPPRCAPNSIATPSELDAPICPGQSTLCPQLVLAPPADVPCNGTVRVLSNVQPRKWAQRLGNKAPGKGPVSQKMKKWNKNNGGRTRTKSPRHLPQSCPQEQNAAHDLPGERSETARRGDLVR